MWSFAFGIQRLQYIYIYISSWMKIWVIMKMSITLLYGNIREISIEILTQNFDELKIDKDIKIRKNIKYKI